MSGNATALVEVRAAVLRKIAAGEMRAVDLLLALANKGYAESDVKQAVSELLREEKIKLTSQRMLKSAATPDSVSRCGGTSLLSL